MPYLNAEIDKDRLGRLRYTRVTVISEADEIEGKVITAINKLVDAYRIVSREYWLNRINERDILFRFADSGGDFGFSYSGAVKVKPSIDQEKLKLLKDLSSNSEPLPAHHIIFLDALRALEEQNYSLAVVYPITFLESIVRQYIDKFSKWQELGKDSSDKLGSLDLFSLVTVVLRLILDKEELPDEIIEEFVKANKIRNHIIHKAKIDVSKEDAEKAYNMTLFMGSILNEQM